MAEKEYIERSVALKKCYRVTEYDEAGFSMSYQAVPVEDILKIPAADVVEVVRCKDCQYWTGNDYDGCCIKNGLSTRFAKDFCSHGERKEQKQTDCLTCRYFVECEPDMIAYHNDPCDLYKERKDKTNG
jgi:hypothetical protein